MGMIKDAEKQFISSLKTQDMICTQMELAKIAIRQDQPMKAVDTYNNGLKKNVFETHLITGIARVHDLLNDPSKAVTFYKKVINFEHSNVEAIASLASYHFYTDQPEVALRFYRRLV